VILKNERHRPNPPIPDHTKFPKRTRLVAAAADLFLKRGCVGTTLAEIAAHSGVPLGNVYYYFQSKRSLAEAVVEYRLFQLRGWLDEANLCDRPEARIRRFLQLILRDNEEIALHGCPFGTLSAELQKHDPSLREVANVLITEQLEWMTAQFRELGKGRRARDLAAAFLARTQGAAVLAHALGDPLIIRRAVQSLDEWIVRGAPGID
jgi:TetR/AcrR family transcriptional repressor of nem operon